MVVVFVESTRPGVWTDDANQRRRGLTRGVVKSCRAATSTLGGRDALGGVGAVGGRRRGRQEGGRGRRHLLVVKTGVVRLSIIGIVINITWDTIVSTRATIATTTIGDKPTVMQLRKGFAANVVAIPTARTTAQASTSHDAHPCTSQSRSLSVIPFLVKDIAMVAHKGPPADRRMLPTATTVPAPRTPRPTPWPVLSHKPCPGWPWQVRGVRVPIYSIPRRRSCSRSTKPNKHHPLAPLLQ